MTSSSGFWTVRGKDITILTGDFNAKTGADDNGYEDLMGTRDGTDE